MAKRQSEASVRRTRQTLATPAAVRRRAEKALAIADGQNQLIPVATRRAIAQLPTGLIGYAPAGPDGSGGIGTPGTLNTYGYITGEDYNPDLDGYPMFPKYDQMRRSDAQVNASLMQIKLPLKAARKLIKVASDDPQDQAIADFVTEVLLADGAFKRPFEQIFDHMLLRFDFGCSGEEIVWENAVVDENGLKTDDAALAALNARSYDLAAGDSLPGNGTPMTRFRDLAPRLPRTFYRWVEWESGPLEGDLKTLQQFAPKHGRYGFWDIPAMSLVLHTHLREGSNWYGRSVLRAAYPHWFWKQQLYRIDAIRHDRLGAGIFIAKLNENYKPQSAPLDKLEETLKGLRSQEQSYAIQPWGVEYDILTPKGTQGNATDIIASINHHNVMIAQNVLQQFSTQGQQTHGSFGAAKVSSEAFFDALEGESVEIGAEIGLAIKAVCDANFNMGGRKYPKFTFADLASADTDAIADNLSKLATAKVITPEDELENYVRDLYDVPRLPVELEGRDRNPPPPAPMFHMPGAVPPGAPPAPPDGTLPPDKVEAATRAPFLENGRKFGRIPTPLERRVMDLHGIPSALDDQQAALVRKLATSRRAQLKAVAAKIAQKDSRATAAFTDIRRKHVTMPGVPDMVKAIRKAQDRALAYGRQTVHDELTKQGVKIPKAKELADNPTAGKNLTTAKSTLVSSAQITARKQAENWQARIMDAGLRIRRVGIQGDQLAAKIVSELEDEVEGGAKRDAAAEVHEAFGLGRSVAASDLSELIESATYSAILDANTCEPCEDLDGEEFDVDTPDYYDALPPYKDCEGRDSCRCVLLYIAKSDADAA